MNISLSSFQLIQNEKLSKFVCEYCHSELVRFSVWKKELIAKQQQLYNALKQQNSNEKNSEELPKIEEDIDSETDGEIMSFVDEEERQEKNYDYDDHSSDDDNDVSTEMDENDEIINCDLESEEDEDESSMESESETFVSSSNHESDSDFMLPARQQSRIYSSLTPTSSKSDFKCNKCESTFLALKGLVMHQKHCKVVSSKPNNEDDDKIRKPNQKKKQRLSDANARFTCNFCNERFYTQRAVSIHYAHIHRFQSISNLNDLRKKTSEIMMHSRYPCISCRYQTNNKKLLMNHMKSHENDPNALISTKCPHCEKKLSTRSTLIVHVKTVHSNHRPYHCQYCDLSFKQMAHLKDHSLSIHQKECKVK